MWNGNRYASHKSILKGKGAWGHPRSSFNFYSERVKKKDIKYFISFISHFMKRVLQVSTHFKVFNKEC